MDTKRSVEIPVEITVDFKAGYHVLTVKLCGCIIYLRNCALIHTHHFCPILRAGSHCLSVPLYPLAHSAQLYKLQTWLTPLRGPIHTPGSLLLCVLSLRAAHYRSLYHLLHLGSLSISVPSRSQAHSCSSVPPFDLAHSPDEYHRPEWLTPCPCPTVIPWLTLHRCPISRTGSLALSVQPCYMAHSARVSHPYRMARSRCVSHPYFRLVPVLCSIPH